MIKYLILLLTLLNSSLFGQNFGDVGTVWKHCFRPDIEPLVFVTETRSVGSFEVDSLVCNNIKLDPGYFLTTIKDFTVCSTDERTYYLEKDSLVLLYDFSLEVGDTLKVQVPVSLFEDYAGLYVTEEVFAIAITPIKLVIDSIELIIADGVELTRQYFRGVDTNYNPFIAFGRYATEKFGFEYFIFPYVSVDYAELNPYSDLISYSDSLINYDSGFNCSLTANSNLDVQEKIAVSPNPVTDLVKVSSDLKISRIGIYNLLGYKVFGSDSNGNQYIDLSRFERGTYVLRIHLEGNTLITRKIIKN